jgi:hypothetical protein
MVVVAQPAALVLAVQWVGMTLTYTSVRLLPVVLPQIHICMAVVVVSVVVVVAGYPMSNEWKEAIQLLGVILMTLKKQIFMQITLPTEQLQVCFNLDLDLLHQECCKIS